MLSEPVALTWSLLILTSSPTYASPVLLGSLTRRGGLGGDDPVTDQRVQFTLHDSEAVNILTPGLGAGVFWTGDALGSADFSIENDVAFEQFASLITNGIDDYLSFIGRVDSGGAVGGGNNESWWLVKDQGLAEYPDFFGFELSFVRLTVNDLNFDRYEIAPGIFIDVEWNVTYEFFGTPIPEPGTLSYLLSAAIAMAFMRRHGGAVPNLRGQ